MSARTNLLVLCVVSTLVAGSAWAAPPALPELPDNASDVARDVLDQLGDGIIPPVPGVPGGPPDGLPPEPLTLPELPDSASDVARDVLDQLRDGIIPPVPGVVDADLGCPGGTVAVVPEPAALAILALGGVALLRRRAK